MRFSINQLINQYIYNAPWYRGACYSADYAETKKNVLSRILNDLCHRLQRLWLTNLLTHSITQSVTFSNVRETPRDGVCCCAGLDVQDIQRSWLVHDNGNHSVDVRRGTVLARTRHHRCVQCQPAVQGLLFHRLGWANRASCLVFMCVFAWFSPNLACCMVNISLLLLDHMYFCS